MSNLPAIIFLLLMFLAFVLFVKYRKKEFENKEDLFKETSEEFADRYVSLVERDDYRFKPSSTNSRKKNRESDSILDNHWFYLSSVEDVEKDHKTSHTSSSSHEHHVHHEVDTSNYYHHDSTSHFHDSGSYDSGFSGGHD